jgi:hypothetical protein
MWWLTSTQDREESARFGQAPIPGKLGMATGEARSFYGNQPNPNNRSVFIGNVSDTGEEVTSLISTSSLCRHRGRTSRT